MEAKRGQGEKKKKGEELNEPLNHLLK